MQEQQEQEEAQQRQEQQDAQQRAQEAAAVAAAQREAHRVAKASSLPAEPAAEGGEATVVCLFRLPDGSRASRRFLLSQPLQLLFDYVDSQGAGGMEFGAYQLVTQYPRRVFVPSSGQSTLSDVGLAAGQEVLLLEPVQKQD